MIEMWTARVPVDGATIIHPRLDRGDPRWPEVAPAAHDGDMENGHGLRKFLMVVVGLFVAGFIAWWLIRVLFSVAIYLIIGAVVVGGGVYLYGRAKRSLTGGRRRIGR